jgi:hypothetical protein
MMNAARRRRHEPEPYGVRCPACHGKESRALEAREGRGDIRRRHLCLSAACAGVTTERKRAGKVEIVYGRRWTTYEFFSPSRGTILVPRDTRAIRALVHAS